MRHAYMRSLGGVWRAEDSLFKQVPTLGPLQMIQAHVRYNAPGPGVVPLTGDLRRIAQSSGNYNVPLRDTRHMRRLTGIMQLADESFLCGDSSSNCVHWLENGGKSFQHRQVIRPLHQPSSLCVFEMDMFAMASVQGATVRIYQLDPIATTPKPPPHSMWDCINMKTLIHHNEPHRTLGAKSLCVLSDGAIVFPTHTHVYVLKASDFTLETTIRIDEYITNSHISAVHATDNDEIVIATNGDSYAARVTPCIFLFSRSGKEIRRQFFGATLTSIASDRDGTLVLSGHFSLNINMLRTDFTPLHSTPYGLHNIHDMCISHDGTLVFCNDSLVTEYMLV
jgi:hypothetical protein